jgi:hypothetical protein
MMEKLEKTLCLNLYSNLGLYYYTLLGYHSKIILVHYHNTNLTNALAVINPPITNRTQQYGNILHSFMFMVDKLFKYSAWV